MRAPRGSCARALLASVLLLAATSAAAVQFERHDTPGDGSFPTGVTLGDWDGDGDLDGAANFYLTGNLQLFINDGTGTFTAGALLDASPTGGPWWLTGGDVDGDGDADIVAAHLRTDELLVYQNDGTGTFGVPTRLPVDSSPEYVIITDLNADGIADLVSPNSTAVVSYYLGTGGGVFVRQPDLPVPYTNGHTVQAADFNGDGKVDVLVSFEPQAGTGTCADRRPPVAIAYGDGLGNFPVVRSQGVEMGYHAVAGDLNGDGAPDAATADVCSGSPEVRVLLNRNDGSGDLDLAGVYPVGTEHNDINAADLDCDGDLDLVIPDNDEAIGFIVLLNDGAGGFITDPDGPFPSDGVPTAAGVGLIDGDARLDLATSNIISDSFSVFLTKAVAGPFLVDVPPDVLAPCDDVPASEPPSVESDCAAPPLVVFSEVRIDGTCPDNYQLVRTWIATDCCGSTASGTQVVTVVDDVPPVVTALLEPLPPASPISARAPRSVCSAPSSATFRVLCSATDNCDPNPVLSALLRVTRQELVGGTCVDRIDALPVTCGEVLVLQLVPPGCPAQPRSAAVPSSATSAGLRVVTGSAIVLEVTATDRCGNEGSATDDPTLPASPCDDPLPDGTCCPRLGLPAGTFAPIAPHRSGLGKRVDAGVASDGSHAAPRGAAGAPKPRARTPFSRRW